MGQFILPGFNTADGSSNISDIHGHGTWVAGTIAALTNNGIGVSSVAPNVRMIPVRVSNFEDGSAYASDIAEGIALAADNGARVVNASYGASESLVVQSAASYMKSKGGLVVMSAGNENTNISYSNPIDIITVGATDLDDAKASFSNYGVPVDVSAPGVGIYTTDRMGGYSIVSGTSFSSPITAAAIALIMQSNPLLTPNEVEGVLLSSSDNVGLSMMGAGRVNVYASVQEALRLGLPPSPPSTISLQIK